MVQTRMTTVPGASAWRPARFQVSMRFPEKTPRTLGQQGSPAVFAHPLVALAIDGTAAALAAVGTAHFTGTWRYVSWGVLVASSLRALVDFKRLMTTPPPKTEETP